MAIFNSTLQHGPFEYHLEKINQKDSPTALIKKIKLRSVGHVESSQWAVVDIVWIIAPPGWGPTVWLVAIRSSHLHAKNNDTGDSDTRVQSSRRHVVVLDPPVVSVLTNPVHENKSTSTPHGKVLYGKKRQPVSCITLRDSPYQII